MDGVKPSIHYSRLMLGAATAHASSSSDDAKDESANVATCQWLPAAPHTACTRKIGKHLWCNRKRFRHLVLFTDVRPVDATVAHKALPFNDHTQTKRGFFFIIACLKIFNAC